MRQTYGIPFWKKAPFTRLLLPFIAGIILQWYVQIPIIVILMALLSFSISFLLFLLLPISLRFKLQSLQGFLIHLLLISLGLLITWQKDFRHNRNWYGNFFENGNYLLVRIDEPLIEKTRSFKANGYVEQVIKNDTLIACSGKLLLYFSKDSIEQGLKYGDRVLIRKDLQLIKNSGNPGAFNYQRYAAFQGISHNVFLKEINWTSVKGNGNDKNAFKQFLFDTREKILQILRKNISAGKDELGIAEALLIGYTNDLDKDLVQAYSNTGVVHIIAISGMHLGLIYILLVWLFARIPLINRSKLIQVVLILGCLWLFSLLTGAAASVLRSAVMFSFITLGNNFSKQTSIYNSLAASAFVMLCYNPYFLWDVGFQLSYLAVIGIIVLQKPIYNCIYLKNKWMDKIWKLMAISLAAQLLTFPICIYYFHQFPNLFLISNIFAVPLSGFILYAEIALLALSWIPAAATYMGKLVSGMVWLMNKIILWINELSFAVWDRIPATILSTWLLYAVVIGSGAWLIKKNKKLFQLSMGCLLAFVVLQAFSSWEITKQKIIIIYNVPQHQAIDFVSGNHYQFIGDSILLEDGLLQNFHLKPGRIALRLDKQTDSLSDIFHDRIFYQFQNKKIMIINKAISIEIPLKKTDIDIIVISKNPKIYISQLVKIFNCRQFVFDASNPAWKIEKWQKECKTLNLPGHSIPTDGAFIYDIGI